MTVGNLETTAGRFFALARFNGGPEVALKPDLKPVVSPVVVPAGGGAFVYTASLTNGTETPLTNDAWIVATLPNGQPYGPVAGPRTVTLAPGASRTQPLTARVPAGAPAGTYTLTLNVGTYPGPVLASSAFTFTKEASAAPSAAPTEPVIASSGAGLFLDDVGTAATSRDGNLVALYPNPTTGRTAVSLSVAEAQPVRVAVFDALGREVAVLHDGAVAAGTAHRLTFDGAGLPAGVYVVRAVGATFADTRTLTLTR